MKYFIPLLAFTLFVQTSFAQEVRLKGTVYAADNSIPVPFATIFNQTRTEGTITNEQGVFSLKVHAADTIRISGVGFENYFFTASEEDVQLSVYLQTSTQQIDTIVITPMPSRERFRQEFMSLELPEENQVDLHIPENMVLQLPVDASDVPVLAQNDIRAPGIAFSSMGGGMKTKLQKQETELDRQKKKFAEIERKYNNDFIGRLTGLQDAEKIAALKKFCKFTNDFILNNTEYDISLAIIDCYKEFEKGQN